MRRPDSFGAKARQNLKLRARLNLSYRDRKRLLQKFVVVRFVECLKEFLQAQTAEDRQRLAARLRLRSMFCAEEKRGEAANVIQMKMADPDGVQAYPVQIFLRHAVNGCCATVQQERARLC